MEHISDKELLKSRASLIRSLQEGTFLSRELCRSSLNKIEGELDRRKVSYAAKRENVRTILTFSGL